MDPNPTPFPGKKQPLKPKPNRKPTEPSKVISKEPSITRQNRVFGTVRNANIPPLRALAAEKPAIKPLTRALPRKQPEWNPTTRVPIPEPAKKKKNSSFEDPKLKLKPKPVGVEDEEEAPKEKTPITRVHTPMAAAAASPSPGHPKSIGGSAYQSAEICSKCRFDRLEMASYWLGQIKLSESVGKHFVSAAFFRLAFESKAEPIRKLRFELKRYLARNGHLEGHPEWREVCVSYGILKDENMAIERVESIIEKLETPKTTRVGIDQELEATNAEDEQRHHASFVKKMEEIEI